MGIRTLAAVGGSVLALGGGAAVAHAHRHPLRGALAGAPATAHTPAAAEGYPRLARIAEAVSHADATVVVLGGVHQVTLDHGRIRSVSPSQLVLAEADGRTVTVPLSAATRVTIDRAPASTSALRAGMDAFAVRIDGHAARSVRVPPGSVTSAAGGI